MKAFSSQVFLVMMLFMTTLGTSWAQSATIRYVALGDSYTIGSGVNPPQAWPSLLTDHLRSSGVDVELVANLARNGWTSQDVLTAQVPVLASLKPDFVTILIGANDWVRGTEKDTFVKQLKSLLDHLQKILPASEQILVVTIPDFSVTPYAQNFGNILNVRMGLAGFNAIIQQEAQARGLKVVDLFKISQRMGEDPSLIVDGLHPSPKGHLMWEEEIYPTALKLLQRRK
jgi:lysophospholipase L1-like esterase